MKKPEPLSPTLKVFLSHASQDKPAVRELYYKLRADGVQSWLDEEALLPGQDWEREVPKEVRNADVVIVCLSGISVSKAGYVQKEIKYALDVADEQPEGAIFLIPLRLEKCAVPDRLRRWQWVDLFDPNGYSKLMLALRRRAEQLKTALSKPHVPKKLSPRLHGRIEAMGFRKEIRDDILGILCHRGYPSMMSLSGEFVLNPVSFFVPIATRERLLDQFQLDGDSPPKVMALDLFLIRGDDAGGYPRLLTYFSGKPSSGWQAYLFPFRERTLNEDTYMRKSTDESDIAAFLGLRAESVSVSTLHDKYVVSVKPDPGYSGLVLYIIEFCSVKFSELPSWLSTVNGELKLDRSTRKFRWFHPEELEQDTEAMRVDADVIRGVHQLFSTTIQAVPPSVPKGSLRGDIKTTKAGYRAPGP